MSDHLATDRNQPRNLVGGRWGDTQPVPGRWIHDPNSGEVLRNLVTTTRDDVEAAISEAHALHQSSAWQRIGPGSRAAFLEDVANLLDHQVEQIARLDSLASGVPIGTTRTIASYIPARFRSAAESCRRNGRTRRLPADGRDVRLTRLPWGPAAILTPWNAPSFIAASKIASALAAGCPVIFKPSEWAAATAGPLTEGIDEALRKSGLPSTAMQTLHGHADVGSVLVSDSRIQVISFTGGQAAGRSIAHAAAENFTVVQLELGGNNPVLVLEDADVGSTAKSLARGMTLLNGQWCEGPGKVLVHRSRSRLLVEALEAELSKLSVGHSLSPASDVGPLVHQVHRDGLAAQLGRYRAAGAEIISPCAIPESGSYLSPSLAVGLDPSDATVELFGPAMTVHSLNSDDEILAVANRSPSGLDAYVYGTDLEHALAIGERVASGEVRVNGAHLADLADESAQGFWGTSGIGGHGPNEAFRVFSGDRIVGIDGGDEHPI